MDFEQILIEVSWPYEGQRLDLRLSPGSCRRTRIHCWPSDQHLFILGGRNGCPHENTGIDVKQKEQREGSWNLNVLSHSCWLEKYLHFELAVSCIFWLKNSHKILRMVGNADPTLTVWKDRLPESLWRGKRCDVSYNIRKTPASTREAEIRGRAQVWLISWGTATLHRPPVRPVLANFLHNFSRIDQFLSGIFVCLLIIFCPDYYHVFSSSHDSSSWPSVSMKNAAA